METSADLLSYESYKNYMSIKPILNYKFEF